MSFFLAFRNLYRNTRRTVAILLTVAFGAGALFSFDGFINGVLTQYRDNTIHSQHGYGQINTEGYREQVYQHPWEHWISDWDRLKPFLLKQEEVTQLFPRCNTPALLKHGNTTVSAFGHGIDGQEESEFFSSLNIEVGKTLTNEAKGILLGNGLAQALAVKPGDTITVMVSSINGSMNKVDLAVTGIFHTGQQDFDSRIFRIQIEEVQQLLGTDKIELIALGMRNLSDWDSLKAKIDAAFPHLETTPFNVLDEVYYQHSVDWLNSQFYIVQLIIISIVLLGIFNSISTSILERKQEVGNFRANGESTFEVMKQFLFEGALLGVLGSVLGIALCYGFLMAFIDRGVLMPPGPGSTREFYVHFSFQWSMAAITTLLSIISALIASAIAGLKVARMPIASALRG